MLFHPNYKFEMYNYRKSFKSLKRKIWFSFELFISEMLKKVPEKSGEIIIFCLSSNTLRDAEEKRFEGKIQTRAKKMDVFWHLDHTANFKVEFLASYFCKWSMVLYALYMTV